MCQCLKCDTDRLFGLHNDVLLWQTDRIEIMCDELDKIRPL